MKWLVARDWKLKIDLKDIWSKYEDLDDDDSEKAIKAGKEIAKAINKFIDHWSGDPKLPEKEAKMLKFVAEELDDRVTDVEGLNFYMNDLWSLGDEYGIWVATAF
jgi:hypothetical protein